MKFKPKNANYNVRDKLRLESIFNYVDCKNKEINNNLLKKNKNLIKTLNGNINKKPDIKTSFSRNFDETTHVNLSENMNNISLDFVTLKNNLKFNNLNDQNNLLLKKKHRMDSKLQKSLDTEIINRHYKNINMHTNLNLLNNKIKIKIKKPDSQ